MLTSAWAWVRSLELAGLARRKGVAMTTFDLAEVRGFAADLDARMDRCDTGEGTECATLDSTLRHYAELCGEFREKVREWGREVFSGRVEFDPEVEQAWQAEGWRLHGRAMDSWRRSQKANGSSSNLDGRALLQSALWDLERLLKGWMTPNLAVGPAARQSQTLDPAAIEEARSTRGVAAAFARGLGTGRSATTGGLSRVANILTGMACRPGPHLAARSRMSDRTPIPLTPALIDLDSPEFETICGWLFADSYVG